VNWASLRIAIVGPMPPPRGGMAGQTEQLSELLRGEGAEVIVVPTNAPYRPAFVGKIRGVRAAVRLAGYVARLWKAAGSVHLLHVMANSGWSWYLFAVPAIWIGRVRGRSVVVNYRGGEAKSFLERSHRWVRPSMSAASALAVPSGFLEGVFAEFGMRSTVVPNIVDMSCFRPCEPGVPTAEHPGESASGNFLARRAPRGSERRVLVARNLERIYDIDTALRAFALVAGAVAPACLVVAGAGSEEKALKRLAGELGISDRVRFTGRLGRDEIAAQYRTADVVLNPSRVDNMPNSLLEAMASGVPIVSTDVGGVPFVVRHGRTALLVSAGDAPEMAAAIVTILRDAELAHALAGAAYAEAHRYTWPRVREVLGQLYESLLSQPAPVARGA
jgi:glycosyltransferase involved in cell wall biosynthesis